MRHRVTEIHRDDWRHCPGPDNPADIGSRGVLGSDLKSEKLWWHGPSWLSKQECEWPKTEGNINTPESEEERKKCTTTLVVGLPNSYSVAQVIDLGRFGNLRKVVRVTARVLRFISCL